LISVCCKVCGILFVRAQEFQWPYFLIVYFNNDDLRHDPMPPPKIRTSLEVYQCGLYVTSTFE
jgi:hypothetical protein